MLLSCLYISSTFGAATIPVKHNTACKFARVNISFQLEEAGVVVPPLTFTVTNATTGVSATLILNNTLYSVPAQEGDIIDFNLAGLIGIKHYTVTATDAFIHFASVELLSL